MQPYRRPITYAEALEDNTTPRRRWLDAGIPEKFIACTFEGYQTETVEQQAALEWAKLYCGRFAERQVHGTCAILIGRVGCGKTHLACAIAKGLMTPPRRFKARYTTVEDMVAHVRSTWGSKAVETSEKAIERYTSPDLLVLDEVGLQTGTDSEMGLIQRVMGLRYNSVRPTIVISNLGTQQITDYLGERIIDRMREGGGDVITFDWESHRGKAVS